MRRIRLATIEDEANLGPLLAQFRVDLKALKGIKATANIEQAKEEVREYLEAEFPIFIAEDEHKVVRGFIVCKIEYGVVWIEALFVNSRFRRQNVATQLFETAEKLAADLGSETVYNWVHPNNGQMIKFLSKMDYNVLNLIEIRKAYQNETLTEKIQIGEHNYGY